MKTEPTHTLAELCALVDLPVRTVRYYAQIGLLDKPDGETRAARYGARHVSQLLQIRKWTDAGLSLQRVRELLDGQGAEVPARPRRAGSVEVVSHLYVADGVEVLIEPTRAGLSPEQLREFTRGVMRLHAAIREQASTQE